MGKVEKSLESDNGRITSEFYYCEYNFRQIFRCRCIGRLMDTPESAGGIAGNSVHALTINLYHTLGELSSHFMYNNSHNFATICTKGKQIVIV